MADENIPEYYSDVFELAMSPYGAALAFGLTDPSSGPGEPPAAECRAVVRMSLQQAKVLSMVLRKNLAQYERENSIEITLPASVYTALGVKRSDWPDVGGR